MIYSASDEVHNSIKLCRGTAVPCPYRCTSRLSRKAIARQSNFKLDTACSIFKFKYLSKAIYIQFRDSSKSWLVF